jgi:transcriptional regulator with XRE-family HTH domain
MDKRYETLTLPQQLERRKKAVSDVLANPQWSLPQAVRHLKKTMHLTTTELAKLAGISFRTLQDIEREKSEGTVQTMNRVFGVLGLKLGVVRVSRKAESGVASVSDPEPAGDEQNNSPETPLV